MENIVFTINGKKVACHSDATILTAAIQNNIDIPTLCYHPQLKPHGACRICLVEDEKNGRLMASCVTPPAKDMSILTNTPRILNHRRNIVRLMMAEHPESCILCSKGNRCELRKIAARLGIGEPDLYPMPNFKPYEQLNPFITRDLSKCILCGKCIRADHALVHAGAIDYNNRGFLSRPATVHETPLEGSNCTFCGTCVSICPTGALSAGNSRFVGTPDKEMDSICGFCGAGCSLSLGVSGQQVVDVNPSRLPETVNGVTLCVRGHFANDFLLSADRLKTPMIASTEENAEPSHVQVSWDDALCTVVSRLSEIKDKHGPQSLAFIGSSKCSNEENYLFQKIARVSLGTNNVVNMGHAFEQKLIALIDAKTKGCCRTNALSELEKAQAIVVVQADTDHAVPVAAYHIKRAAGHSTSLVVLDSRKTDLVPPASVWLRPVAKDQLQVSIADVLNALTKGVIQQKAHDQEFINAFTEGFHQLNDTLNALDAEHIASQNSIPGQSITKAVELLAGKKIAVVIGGDILHQSDGNRIVDALVNLVMVTGSLGVKGAGFYIPTKENNTTGALDMGMVPEFLPGRKALRRDSDREVFEKIWQVKLSPEPGMDIVRLIEAAESGQLKAAYIMGENLLRSLPQPERVKNALKKLDFIVVQDIVDNQTAKIAHVILPGAAFAEKGGSFTNMEGRIQTFEPTVAPPGQAKPDLDILTLLINKLGYPEQNVTIETIQQEIRQAVPLYSDFGHQRQSWIKYDHTGSPLSGGGTKFSFAPVLEKKDSPADTSFPFTAVIGSLRFHLGSGTRTSRSERIQAHNGIGKIEISPSDCRKLALNDSGKIRVTSSSGTIEREYKTNPGLPPGQIFIPFAVSGNDVMNLVALSQPDQPDKTGWTSCRVNIEKI